MIEDPALLVGLAMPAGLHAPTLEWVATLARLDACKADTGHNGDTRASALKGFGDKVAYAASIASVPTGGDDGDFQGDTDFAQREREALGKEARD